MSSSWICPGQPQVGDVHHPVRRAGGVASLWRTARSLRWVPLHPGAGAEQKSEERS